VGGAYDLEGYNLAGLKEESVCLVFEMKTRRFLGLIKPDGLFIIF
jgi:hypothetical protein